MHPARLGRVFHYAIFWCSGVHSISKCDMAIKTTTCPLEIAGLFAAHPYPTADACISFSNGSSRLPRSPGNSGAIVQRSIAS